MSLDHDRRVRLTNQLLISFVLVFKSLLVWFPFLTFRKNLEVGIDLFCVFSYFFCNLPLNLFLLCFLLLVVLAFILIPISSLLTMIRVMLIILKSTSLMIIMLF